MTTSSAKRHIGVHSGALLNSVENITKATVRAEQDGFDSVWIPQIFDVDALTALAVAGQTAKNIDVGVAVIPAQPRHPMALAAQALTAQSALSSSLLLGVGLSHKVVVEDMWGMSYGRPIKYMSEYLSILQPLLTERRVSFSGELLTCHGQLNIDSEQVPQLVIAALGEQMLRLVGSRGIGTTTWATGSKAIIDHIIPTLFNAAEDSGHAQPPVIVHLPVCVTTEPDRVNEQINKAFAIYPTLPSYRAMMDIDAADLVADISFVGSQDHVTSSVEALFAAGVTHFIGTVMGNRDEQIETRQSLVALKKSV